LSLTDYQTTSVGSPSIDEASDIHYPSSNDTQSLASDHIVLADPQNHSIEVCAAYAYCTLSAVAASTFDCTIASLEDYFVYLHCSLDNPSEAGAVSAVNAEESIGQTIGQ